MECAFAFYLALLVVCAFRYIFVQCLDNTEKTVLLEFFPFKIEIDTFTAVTSTAVFWKLSVPLSMTLSRAFVVPLHLWWVHGSFNCCLVLECLSPASISPLLVPFCFHLFTFYICYVFCICYICFLSSPHLSNTLRAYMLLFASVFPSRSIRKSRATFCHRFIIQLWQSRKTRLHVCGHRAVCKFMPQHRAQCAHTALKQLPAWFGLFWMYWKAFLEEQSFFKAKQSKAKSSLWSRALPPPHGPSLFRFLCLIADGGDDDF